MATAIIITNITMKMKQGNTKITTMTITKMAKNISAITAIIIITMKTKLGNSNIAITITITTSKKAAIKVKSKNLKHLRQVVSQLVLLDLLSQLRLQPPRHPPIYLLKLVPF
jgi:hypothetical protein